MYHSAKEIIDICEMKNLSMADLVLQTEIQRSGETEEVIINQMEEIYEVMAKSSHGAIEKEIKSISGLIGGNAKKVYDYATLGTPICGKSIGLAMAYALSTSELNAAMGRIVAAPTAGSSGIVPAVLFSMKEEFDLEKEMIVKALFVISGIGQIINENGTFAGAVGGCQVECGSAAAMAAGAAVFLRNGNVRQIFDSASIAMINIMGLVCDPIAGLVEFPCAIRNASGAVNAILSADLALAGTTSLIPFDEVLEASVKVGKAMPSSLRETGEGGVAATKTGCKLRENLFRKEGEIL